MEDENRFWLWIEANFTDELEKQRVMKAWKYAFRAHYLQLRRTGRAFIRHPEEVAFIVKSLGLPVEFVIAALLHDTTEDCSQTREEIKDYFGPMVAWLVHFMNRTQSSRFDNYSEKFDYYLEMDPRVILLRLADCLANLREYKGYKSEESRARAAKYALELIFRAKVIFEMILLVNQKFNDFFDEIEKEATKYA